MKLYSLPYLITLFMSMSCHSSEERTITVKNSTKLPMYVMQYEVQGIVNKRLTPVCNNDEQPKEIEVPPLQSVQIAVECVLCQQYKCRRHIFVSNLVKEVLGYDFIYNPDRIVSNSHIKYRHVKTEDSIMLDSTLLQLIFLGLGNYARGLQCVDQEKQKWVKAKERVFLSQHQSMIEEVLPSSREVS